MGAGRVFTRIANQASVLGLLLASCHGGQTGQPDSAREEECPKDSTPASDTMARFEGSYVSPVVAPSNGASCPPEADTVLHVEIESDFDERELLERECGAAWLPVSVELATDDGELVTTESGWLTVADGVGGVRIDEPTWGGGVLILTLDAEQRSVSSSTRLRNYGTIDACCLEEPSQGFPELVPFDELGLIALVPGDPDVVGQEQIELELRVTAAPLTNGCFESADVNQPVSFELLDAEGVVVASGTGEAQGARCERGEGCVFVELHADGKVSNPSYLGAAQPLKGIASRVFLEAEFDSCESPRAELGISVDVALAEHSIEMSLRPAPGASAIPPSGAARRGCFCWSSADEEALEGCP